MTSVNISEFFWGGSSSASSGCGSGGTYRNYRLLSTSGQYVTSGTGTLHVLLMGGSGSGAISKGNGGASCTTGGGAGEIAFDTIPVTPGQVFNIVLGAGGAAITYGYGAAIISSNGFPGGNSTMTGPSYSLTVNGGGGGKYTAALPAAGGLGGTGGTGGTTSAVFGPGGNGGSLTSIPGASGGGAINFFLNQSSCSAPNNSLDAGYTRGSSSIYYSAVLADSLQQNSFYKLPLFSPSNVLSFNMGIDGGHFGDGYIGTAWGGNTGGPSPFLTPIGVGASGGANAYLANDPRTFVAQGGNGMAILIEFSS